jgi:hypothetical protein
MQNTRQVNQSQNTQSVHNIPEKKFSAGGISATVWANQKTVNGSPIEIKTISLSRAYKDKDGSWKQGSSLRINDIPKAQLVLEKAYEYLALKDEVSA